MFFFINNNDSKETNSFYVSKIIQGRGENVWWWQTFIARYYLMAGIGTHCHSYSIWWQALMMMPQRTCRRGRDCYFVGGRVLGTGREDVTF